MEDLIWLVSTDEFKVFDGIITVLGMAMSVAGLLASLYAAIAASRARTAAREAADVATAIQRGLTARREVLPELLDTEKDLVELRNGLSAMNLDRLVPARDKLTSALHKLEALRQLTARASIEQALISLKKHPKPWKEDVEEALGHARKAIVALQFEDLRSDREQPE